MELYEMKGSEKEVGTSGLTCTEGTDEPDDPDQRYTPSVPRYGLHTVYPRRRDHHPSKHLSNSSGKSIQGRGSGLPNA
jgi:hypothetical protein